jgi:drug/metabolite transporter (DMT)-like permease
MASYSSKNFVKAVVLKIGSAVLFSVMAILVRYLGTGYPVGQVIFFRAIFALIPIAIYFSLRGELSRSWQTQRFPAHIFRGALSIASAFCYYGALSRLPVTDTTAISFMAPLITVVLAAIFLQEVVHAYRWSAVMVGFAGVIVMLIPYFDLSQHAGDSMILKVGLVLAVLNAILSSIAVIQVRRLTDTETTSAIVIYFSLFIGLGGLATLPFGWNVPTSMELAALIGAGFCGGMAHIMSTSSYRFAPASFLAPFDYTSMIWVTILGFAVFGEAPAGFVLLGAAIVVASSLFVIWRERQLGLRRQREQEAVPARG